MSDQTITRADIAEALSARCGVSRAFASRFLETMLDTMSQTLARGEMLKLARFGNFVVREKNERIGRNPKTGEAARITPRKVVTFRPSQLMRQRVEKAEAD